MVESPSRLIKVGGPFEDIQHFECLVVRDISMENWAMALNSYGPMCDGYWSVSNRQEQTLLGRRENMNNDHANRAKA